MQGKPTKRTISGKDAAVDGMIDVPAGEMRGTTRSSAYQVDTLLFKDIPDSSDNTLKPGSLYGASERLRKYA